MIVTEIVYGSRMCSCGCRGLITGEAYRYDVGRRKRYFSSRLHVKWDMERRLTKIMKPLHVKPTPKIVEEETDRFIKEFLEKVIVKPPEY